MEGGLIDGQTLRRALGVMTFGQGMVLLGRLLGLSEGEMAEAFGVGESDVAWFMGLARDEVARRAQGAEVLLDVRSARHDSPARERLLEQWKAVRATGYAEPGAEVVLEVDLRQEAGAVVAYG